MPAWSIEANALNSDAVVGRVSILMNERSFDLYTSFSTVKPSGPEQTPTDMHVLLVMTLKLRRGRASTPPVAAMRTVARRC